MSEFLAFTVIGIVAGSTYAIAASGPFQHSGIRSLEFT